MAEGTYEYECMRAELLGMPRPDEQEWLEKQKERLEHQNDEVENKTLEELDKENEQLNNVSGGLEELSNILSITQKKLNRFKSVCGSLTNLLKIKVGHDSEGSTESIPKTEQEELDNAKNEEENPKPSGSEVNTTEVRAAENGAFKPEIQKNLSNQVEKLDSLVTNAETLQYRMQEQQKRMKKLLK